MSIFKKYKELAATKLTEEELRKHRCAFTGHRPEKLIGKESYAIVELRKSIVKAIDEGYTTFITGCSRGTDLWAADIVIEMRRYDNRLRLICAVPFEGFDDKWTIDWKKHLKLVRNQADWVQVLGTTYTPDAYHKRNAWMISHSSKLIAVCDGSPSGTKNTIEYACAQEIPVDLIQV